MTEEEAKKKICCGSFHMETDNEWTKCRGSGCMAWRWDISPEQAKQRVLDLERSGASKYPDFPMGHCGLAGKP